LLPQATGFASFAGQTKNSVKLISQSFNKTRAKVAKKFGTNATSVSRAEKLLEESPELFKEVKAGKKTITAAMRELHRSESIEKSSNPLVKFTSQIVAKVPTAALSVARVYRVESEHERKQYERNHPS